MPTGQPFQNWQFWLDLFRSTCFDYAFRNPGATGGLPTSTDCDLRYMDGLSNNTYDTFFESRNISTFAEGECWAFSTHDYGHNIGRYLFVYMIFDIGICHTIDFLCPEYWIATKILARFCHYQRDLNKIFEGVDFKAYMRFQLLLKFIFMGCLLNQVDGPRLMNFWVALCFGSCMQLERFCFVKYYRRGPMYSMDIMFAAINWCLPAALLMKLASSVFIFAITWSFEDKSYTPFMAWFVTEDDPTATNRFDGQPRYKLNSEVINAFGVYWALVAIFIVAFLLPLPIWNFHSGDSFGCGTQLHRRVMADRSLSANGEYYLRTVPKDLSFSDALNAVEDRARGKENTLNKICRIEVSKYIPDPKRREFGMMFVN
jgi:hypothetical protein